VLGALDPEPLHGDQLPVRGLWGILQGFYGILIQVFLDVLATRESVSVSDVLLAKEGKAVA
jgi:hypothetical protein